MGSLEESQFRSEYGSKMEEMAGFPGPTPSFPAGNAQDLAGDRPWEVCADYGRKYGPVTLVWVFSAPVLVLNSPELIGEVLDTRSDEFYKLSPCEALRPVVTDACPFIVNGSDWQFKRTNHPLAIPDVGPWLDTQVTPMKQALADGVRQIVERSRTGPIDLLAEVKRLSFDAFSVAVWGTTLGDDAYEWFLTMEKTGDSRIKSTLPTPPAPDAEFCLQQERWNDLYATLIGQAKRQPEPGRVDLMSLLLRRETKLSDEGFRASLANIFFGGVFSVTSAITTTLYLLARHPKQARKLRGAIDALPISDPGFDRKTLEACAPLDHVLREALRYYTPVPIYSRNTLPTRTVTLAGKPLPPNTSVIITNWLLHRSGDHWRKPDRFDPGRWADGGVERDPLGSGYFFPFGRGPRMCVGLPFAMFHMKLALATLLSQAKVAIDPELPYVQKICFGVMSPQGLTARLEAR